MVNYSPVKLELNIRELWAVRGFRWNVIGAIVLTLIASPIVYMAADQQRPYDFKSEGSFVLPPEAQGGDQITVMWKVAYHRTCPGELRRVLFDPVTKVETGYAVETAAGADSLKNGYLNKTFLLPRALVPGWWGYRADLCYACNPLQRVVSGLQVCYSTPNLYFKVSE